MGGCVWVGGRGTRLPLTYPHVSIISDPPPIGVPDKEAARRAFVSYAFYRTMRRRFHRAPRRHIRTGLYRRARYLLVSRGTHPPEGGAVGAPPLRSRAYRRPCDRPGVWEIRTRRTRADLDRPTSPGYSRCLGGRLPESTGPRPPALGYTAPRPAVMSAARNSAPRLS